MRCYDQKDVALRKERKRVICSRTSTQVSEKVNREWW